MSRASKRVEKLKRLSCRGSPDAIPLVMERPQGARLLSGFFRDVLKVLQRQGTR